MTPRYWQACETFPGRRATLAEWRSAFGEQWPIAQKYLIPTSVVAANVPLTNEHGEILDYAIVAHGEGDFVGVNEEHVDSRPLSKCDVLLYRLDVGRIAKGLCSLLGISSSIVPATVDDGVVGLGSFQVNEMEARLTYLIIATSANEMVQLADKVIVETRGNGIVFVPTTGNLSSRADASLRANGWAVLSMDSSVSVSLNGVFVCDISLPSVVKARVALLAGRSTRYGGSNPTPNAIHVEGNQIHFTYLGKQSRHNATVGMRIIRTLVAAKRQELHATELRALALGRPAILENGGIELGDEMTIDQLEKAIRRNEEAERLAKQSGQGAKAAEIHKDLESLRSFLLPLKGRAGKPRGLLSQAERDRQSVKQGITSALQSH